MEKIKKVITPKVIWVGVAVLAVLTLCGAFANTLGSLQKDMDVLAETMGKDVMLWNWVCQNNGGAIATTTNNGVGGFIFCADEEGVIYWVTTQE